jgi:hypothetical protein
MTHGVRSRKRAREPSRVEGGSFVPGWYVRRVDVTNEYDLAGVYFNKKIAKKIPGTGSWNVAIFRLAVLR